jgi:WD40 repeat protein
LWNLEKEPNEPAVSLSGHKKSIRCVDFHPTAENVLASNSLDLTLRLWDVEYGKEKNSIEGKMDKPLYNMSFNYDGSLLAASGKDKVLRIFDPRNNGVLSMGCGHEGAKAQFVTWCSTSSSIATSYLLSVGFNARNERQINIWDARNLLDPAFSTTMYAEYHIK